MNCILTLAIGEPYDKLADLTHPSIKAYAKKIGADFVCADKTTCTSPHWEKFNQIYLLLNKYERILYIDTDIIIRDDCPNLFDIVPVRQLGLFNEAPFTVHNREISIIEACKSYGIKLKGWNHKYYNTGVIVLSRQHKFLFKKPEKEIFNFYEQGYFNAILAKKLESHGNELSVHELDYKFNRMTCMDQLTGEERFASYMIHYAGYPNLNFILSLIPTDLQRWEQTKPEYNYQRHILIDVHAGLGDQISAEPTIRFLKENVYPGEDISIITHYPTIFKHLDIPVYLHGEFQRKPDTPYYHVQTMPGPESGMWRWVSGLLCHSVDFSSMALLRRILPNKDKTIRLKTELEHVSEIIDTIGIRNLSELVLIHPGRHWQTKTFPKSWWQEIIDGLQEKCGKVCLIGANNETRGVLDVDAKNGVLDTRDLLSLDATIALISAAKVLVSNDSAPIYIAGAFDTEIVLIPTCKHPDHILPWRHGSQTYKATALYNKLLIDEFSSQPTEIGGVLADKFDGDLCDYLPETKNVIDHVLRIVK